MNFTPKQFVKFRRESRDIAVDGGGWLKLRPRWLYSRERDPATNVQEVVWSL